MTLKEARKKVISYRSKDDLWKYFQEEKDENIRELILSVVKNIFYKKDIDYIKLNQIIQFAENRGVLKQNLQIKLAPLYFVNGEIATTKQLNFLLYRINKQKELPIDIEASLFLNHIDLTQSQNFADDILNIFITNPCKENVCYMHLASLLGNEKLLKPLKNLFNNFLELEQLDLAKNVLNSIELIKNNEAIELFNELKDILTKSEKIDPNEIVKKVVEKLNKKGVFSPIVKELEKFFTNKTNDLPEIEKYDLTILSFVLELYSIFPEKIIELIFIKNKHLIQDFYNKVHYYPNILISVYHFYEKNSNKYFFDDLLNNAVNDVFYIKNKLNEFGTFLVNDKKLLNQFFNATIKKEDYSEEIKKHTSFYANYCSDLFKINNINLDYFICEELSRNFKYYESFAYKVCVKKYEFNFNEVYFQFKILERLFNSNKEKYKKYLTIFIESYVHHITIKKMMHIKDDEALDEITFDIFNYLREINPIKFKKSLKEYYIKGINITEKQIHLFQYLDENIKIEIVSNLFDAKSKKYTGLIDYLIILLKEVDWESFKENVFKYYSKESIDKQINVIEILISKPKAIITFVKGIIKKSDKEKIFSFLILSKLYLNNKEEIKKIILENISEYNEKLLLKIIKQYPSSISFLDLLDNKDANFINGLKVNTVIFFDGLNASEIIIELNKIMERMKTLGFDNKFKIKFTKLEKNVHNKFSPNYEELINSLGSFKITVKTNNEKWTFSIYPPEKMESYLNYYNDYKKQLESEYGQEAVLYFDNLIAFGFFSKNSYEKKLLLFDTCNKNKKNEMDIKELTFGYSWNVSDGIFDSIYDIEPFYDCKFNEIIKKYSVMIILSLFDN